jgi:hypothetical protein
MPRPMSKGDLLVAIERERGKLDAVLVAAWFRSSREEMRGVIEALADEQPFAPGRFAWTRKNALGTYFVSATSSHDLWARTRIAP